MRRCYPLRARCCRLRSPTYEKAAALMRRMRYQFISTVLGRGASSTVDRHTGLNERYTLVRNDGRLELLDTHAASRVPVCLDIADVRRRMRQGRRLAIAKACGVRRDLNVLDAMAGYGLDGITLAALGCRVLMLERDPLLYALLEDAVARARAELQLGPIECQQGDAREVLSA